MVALYKNFFHRALLLSGATLLLYILFCALPPLGQAATEKNTASTAAIMQHPGWQRLDALLSRMPFAWARRYLELKSIAEDTDIYSQRLPQQLQRLGQVSAKAQSNVVALLLDMVAAQGSVQECNYIVGQLEQWDWQLEAPLRGIATTATTLEHFSKLLDSTGQAVEKMRANALQRPIMQESAQDFNDLYDLVQQRTQSLLHDIREVRGPALELVHQIRESMTTAQARFPAQWLDYYIDPLPIPRSGFSRLGVDLLTMASNWTYDESHPYAMPFAILFNVIVIGILSVCLLLLKRVSPTPNGYFRTLCGLFLGLDAGRKVGLACCVLFMLDSLVDALPQMEAGVPFIFVGQILMGVALALWARTSPADPKVWELALPITAGLLVMHGDASALVILLVMGTAILLPLSTLAFRKTTEKSGLRTLYLTALALALPLILLGFGRLAIPLLMLFVLLAGCRSLWRLVGAHPSLGAYTIQRALFVPIFTVFLVIMGISFLLANMGFDFLLNYWHKHAVPIGGFQVYFGDAALMLLSLLGLFFFSNIVGQSLESLARKRRHVLDISAVPVLRTVVNCLLWGLFAVVVMHNMGLDVSSLAFVGGGLTVGIGIASKTILSNFFCGLVLIFSRMVRAGDTVELNKVRGRVLSVNMRATVIETSSSGIMMVPNEELLNSRMTNWTLNNRHVLEEISVRVAPESPVIAVLTTMEGAAANQVGILTDPPPKAFFTGFSASSMEFSLQIWLKDVNDRKTVLSTLRQNVLDALAQHNVTLPTPHLAVTMAQSQLVQTDQPHTAQEQA